MDSDSCSVSGSSSSSSPSLLAAAAADRMVKIEIEAAEALAGMAHLAMRVSGGESGRSWGNKGKRARKRVKDESLVVDLGLNPFDPMPRCSDLSEDRSALVDLKQCEKLQKNLMVKSVKAEQDSELPVPIPSCSRSYSSVGGGRSRQNLTEAEKEARRLRRVLANRESARQTIRRRQALCEDLTRKASNLAWENENLKKEKESVLKEYQSLETTNKHLKAQVAKAIKAEVEETPGELKSAHVDISTSSSTDCPLHLYNRRPFAPMFWTAVIRSPNPVQSQHGHQDSTAFPSNVLMPAIHKPESYNKQENFANNNQSRTPLYMLPCPWFFPLPNRNGLNPQLPLGLNNKPDENSANNQYGACSSSRSGAHVDDHHLSLPIRVKTEASRSIEAGPTIDLDKTPVGFLPDGGGPHIGSNCKEKVFKHATLSSVEHSFSVKHENGLHSDYTSSLDVSSTPSQITNSLTEKNQKTTVHSNKKLADAVAAAEARKRRKEITKLKNIQGRKCQIQC